MFTYIYKIFDHQKDQKYAIKIVHIGALKCRSRHILHIKVCLQVLGSSTVCVEKGRRMCGMKNISSVASILILLFELSIVSLTAL